MKVIQEVRAVLFERSPGEWVAQCLEVDIGAQATNLPDVIYQLQRALVGHIVIALENGMEPFADLQAAPQEYFQMFDRATETFRPKRRAFSAPMRAPVPRLTVGLAKAA